MLRLIEEPRLLPTGSHGLSFHATRNEAARNAISFLAGTPRGQSASYWVADEATADYYRKWLGVEFPDHVGCVAILPHEQVESVDGRLRPVSEVKSFLEQHPEGVTAAGETLSRYWTRETLPAHLEYESWFQSQPNDASRFLCPYDLRTVPPDMAPEVLQELGSHHTHVTLSPSQEPGVRLLQLFVFPTVDELPECLEINLGWSIKRALTELLSGSRELSLTHKGEQVVREWGETAVIDW